MKLRFLLIAALSIISLSGYSQDRWAVSKDGSIVWKTGADRPTVVNLSFSEDSGEIWTAIDNLPHSDFIEMSGLRVSTVVRYSVNATGAFSADLSVVWPMLRTIPNNTHASLNRHFSFDVLNNINCGIGHLKDEKTESVTLNGTLQTLSKVKAAGRDLELSRTLFPSTDKPVFCTKYVLKNISDRALTLEIPAFVNEYATPAEQGVAGSYKLVNFLQSDKKVVLLEPGKEYSFSNFVIGLREGEALPTLDVDAELAARQAFVAQLWDNLILETPDSTMNAMFAFAKIRASESIFATKGGLLHGPGGERYYAAIWTNDQAEYVNPFFPFLGYDKGNESAMNSYMHFARFMNPDYKPIPSSIIAEGDDIWNGAGDRGDAAMLAYGASRYALSSGSKEEAEKLWPLIEWCLEYCKRNLNEHGVVNSDSDELENRFPSGDANLCTSSLYYDALNSAAFLAKELHKDSKAYSQQAKAMRENIESFFGANVEGYDTYRYYDGNDKLRSWICVPLVMGIFDRRDATLDALFEKLWTQDGLLSQSGTSTYWDRSTLYAFRGALYGGATDRVSRYLTEYAAKRLRGEHVPYAIEAWPEGDQRQLSAESGLYCRVFTEGLFGIRPTGLRSFTTKITLPLGWKKMSLQKVKAFGSCFDIDVQGIDDKNILVTVTSEGRKVLSKKVKQSTELTVKL